MRVFYFDIFRSNFNCLFQRLEEFCLWRLIIRLLLKPTVFEKFIGAPERRTGAYVFVREDSSTAVTQKLPKREEFRERSIPEELFRRHMYPP